MHDQIDRRAALGTFAVAGLGATAAFASRPTPFLTRRDLGWDEAAGEYVLPPLPYAYDALVPHIDEQTMQIHHDKHHAGYVRGLNKAVAALKDARSSSDSSLIQHWERQLAFHGGGHVNHTLFWTGMAPAGSGGGGKPSGSLAEAINKSFGSFDAFQFQFKAAAGAVEGSGWGWLVYEPISSRLLVTQMENQQKMLFAGVVPLLGVDVWEHAYYLNYQNRRADYVTAFMNVINWSEIQRRYDAATA